MRRTSYHLVRIVFGLIFVVAAYHKIIRPDQFADGINNYHILPVFLVNLAAITLPYIELLFGIFLVFNKKVSSASLALNILMVIFLVAIISAWSRGINTACGCFSNEGENISLFEVARDFTFLALGIYVFITSRTKPWRKRSTTP